MIRSVRIQLTLWYIGSISLLVLVFGVIAYFSLQAILLQNLDTALYNAGQALGDTLSDYTLHDEEDPESLYEFSDEGEPVFLVDRFDEEAGETFFVSVVYAQLRAPLEELETDFPVIAQTTNLNELTLPFSQENFRMLEERPYYSETIPGLLPFPVRVLSVSVYDQEERPYILQLALSLQDLHTTLRNLLVIFAVLFPALMAILSVLGYMFMKRAFAPVKKMVAVARRITAEDLSLRLDPLDSRDEIGELAETLNDMIARLEGSFKQIQQFSGDVSHELKTPLAELKCNAEVALRRKRPVEEYREVLKNVIEDAERLWQIVEDLLLLARMDARTLPLIFAPVALNEIFFDVFEQMHPLAGQKNLSISFEEIESVTIPGEAGLLKRLLTNLIANTIRYTPSGGAISFALHQNHHEAVLIVTDTGIGIPEEHLPSIFDRFYRVEQSRSHETGGSGLGLAIAQKIVALHGGTITVHSTVAHGTTFRVSLPKPLN